MKPPKINIDPDTLHDCLWMSYRYCIGRSTIAAHMHAADIAECMRDNPKFLTEERRRFLGRDIRGEINNRLHLRDNISVDGYQEHHDALSLVLACCIEHGIKPSEIGKYKFHADAVRGVCCAEPYEFEGEHSPIALSIMDIEDFMVWVKLAGYLDPAERITWSYNGETRTADGFAFYDIDPHEDCIEARHVYCDKYAEGPSRSVSIQDKYITKIEKI